MGVAAKDNEFDVIIVGGGITGAGTARDCAFYIAEPGML